MNEKKYYSVPCISNSALTWFKVSPKYCLKRMNHEIVDLEKSYTYLGKQLHMSLLEPEEFEKNYTYLDFKTPASKQQLGFCESYVSNSRGIDVSHEVALIDAYTENYIAEKMTDTAILKTAERIYEQNSEYIKYLEIKGDYREVLSKSRKELITTVTNAINSHKKANVLMNSNAIEQSNVKTFNEFALFWDFPIEYEGELLKCKSLIDRLVVDHKNKKVIIVDLKTTSVLGDMKDIIDERDYYRQLAFYRLAVQHSTKLFPNNYEIEAYIVSVNTQDPYECRVYKLTDAEYQKQVIEISNLMKQISWHWFTNQWDYSRAYYEGDGTENSINEYSNESIEGNNINGSDKIRFTDDIFEG